jgi:SlyX protein
MDEDRLIDIETRLAHQDHLLAQLNDALTDQQAQLMQVTELCQSLIERMRTTPEASTGAGPDDERPPHY